MRVGDMVSDGALRGIVVAQLDQNEFTPEYPREQWSYLERGVMVETEEVGLVHFPDAMVLVVVNP
jgi:hypothetical protein